ncbi:hypothetical protein MTBLM5_70125 [Magnetospirillum sp. LM-5]|uniref:hypothetical protein n=1 Tax=Magnetospirillum sp. LM-5 TaxID=2681466 RepID=UPI001383B022|nr:hypothetical protein [Magnetospirillum sp. LM-5]CAA7624935.1 hypothetical protein MTBLM5_70125 [Magnetospirillum sp. LM-5]
MARHPGRHCDLGLLLLLGGTGWVANVYLRLDATMRAWAIVPAATGGLAAGAGLILMLATSERSPKRYDENTNGHNERHT